MEDKLYNIKVKWEKEKADIHTDGYVTIEDVEWLIEQVERLEGEVEYLANRKEEILVESGKRWTKLLKIRDILGQEL